MDDKEKTFMVTAQIPVIESDGFANEIRKTTSGQANPNLRFSHYETIDGDPYYEGTVVEDDEDLPYIESAIRANKLMKDVRKRKGLLVDEQVVIHAEKQRTLNKKK
ncbi:Elongation factor G C-terminus [Popillia japonica]|uniref:Elongation factor G C-terminus n=1 Tax=Popillia japonica TaxID=7064 RepID=A0AAW1KJ06_POPJA